MNGLIVSILIVSWSVIGVGCWLGWQLLRQSGRMLLRIDELEKRFDELEFGELDETESGSTKPRHTLVAEGRRTRTEASLSNSGTLAGENILVPVHGQDRLASRFSNRSLARSRIKRDGLQAGTSAPSFRLPRLDGGQLSLEELRGKRLLLVFSDPDCGPCNALAPELEKFHRCEGLEPRTPSPPSGKGEPAPIQVVVISRGEPKDNRAKVKEHGLSFLIVLQQRWEISRLYAMFATPMAYLIDESGIIMHDVAVGVESILDLMTNVTGAKKLQTNTH